MAKRKLTTTERHAKYWIAKRLGMHLNGLNDVELCRIICEETKWPAPSKKQRKPLLARYWREVLQGQPPAEVPFIVSPPRLKRPKQKVFTKRVLRKEFYISDEWRAVRYQALKIHGARCQCCGLSPREGKVMHVDHIKPRSKYPELELTLSNLQVLCEDCNLGKMARDQTDWRPDQQERLSDEAEEHMRSILN